MIRRPPSSTRTDTPFPTRRSSVLKVLDFPLHADPATYRGAVSFIRDDPLSLGALVTTHKIDLFHACRDLFDDVDAYAALMGETSCLSKREGRLVCHAKDPISSGLAIDGFLEPDHFARPGAEVFSIGAGGSTFALRSEEHTSELQSLMRI